MGRFASFGLLVAATAIASAPAAAADDFRAPAGLEHHRAAFAGATLRFDLGGRAASPPRARLGIGLTDYQRDQTGYFASRGGPRQPVEAGLADGRLQLFVGGERLSQLHRRLGAAESNVTTFAVVGGLAAGALAVFLLADDDSDDGPCPPGVEVCAFQ